jgi:hypothetical protein
LLFRHPLAVASSRTHHEWNNDLGDFLKQERLMADFLEPHRAFIAAVDDPFEKHITQWCIENLVPLRQFRRGEIHLAFYENFTADPRAEVGRLFAFLGKPVSESVFQRIERPSTMTWVRPGAQKPRPSDVDSWRRYVSKERIARSLDILARFGLESIYSEAPLPDIDACSRLMAPR